MNLNFIHSRLAITVVLYFIAMMIWAFWRFLRKQEIDPNFRGGIIISGLLMIIQATIGSFLWLNNFRPDQGEMHILYGIVGVIGIPLVFIFVKEKKKDETCDKKPKKTSKFAKSLK